MHMKEVGDFLQSLRKSKGLTQQELADMLNVSNKTVSKWENGLGMPEMSTLLLLSDIYQVTVDDILRGSRKMQKSDDKPLERFDYIIKKSKHQFYNHFMLSAGMLILGLIAYFITHNLSESSILPVMISLVFVVTSSIIHFFNLNRVKYQLIECNRDIQLKTFFRHVFFTSLILLLGAMWLFLFSILNSTLWVNPSVEGTLYASMLPAFAIASIHTLIIYGLFLVFAKFSFNIKPTIIQSIMFGIYILLVIIPFAILSIYPVRDVAIKLSWTNMGISYAYRDQQESHYYRIRLLKIVNDEFKNGKRLDEIYEIRLSPDSEDLKPMVYYQFNEPTPYELWIDQAYFEDFLLNQGYSNFEITDDKAVAYIFGVSDQQLVYEVYGYIFGILAQTWIYAYLIVFVVIKIKQRKVIQETSK